MIHVAELKTRSYECDSYGHINNATYLNYLEYARIEFLEDLPISHRELRRRGVGFVVTRICIDYRLQVGGGETLRIETRAIKKERIRVVFQQNIYRGDQLIAEAQVTWACVNEQGRPIRLPPELDVPELEPDPKTEPER
jgi:acyl-CoA thioester hydrolase